MIKKIQIKKVEVYGFKGFEKLYTFEFKTVGRNIIIGDNTKGKTSVGEAIVWGFTGKNIAGNVKEINVLNNKSKTANVTIYFIDENGNDHVLERKMNTNTTIKLDDEQLSQEKLKNHIDIDMFLMIFNPLYYISLDSNNARKAIYPLFPQITKTDVFAKLNKEDKDILDKEAFDETNTNDYLKEQRKKVSKITDDLKYLEGYMDKLNQPIVIPEVIAFDENKITEVENQIKDLKNKKPELKDLEKLLLVKADLDKRIYEIKNEEFKSEKIQSELKHKKALLQQELTMKENSKYTPVSISEYEKQLTSFRCDYAVMALENKNLQAEKKKLSEEKVKFNEGDICPTCKQSISKHSIKALNDDLSKENSAKVKSIEELQETKIRTLEDLEKEGKELVATITKAKEVNEKAKAEFYKEKAEEISSLNKQIQEIDEEINNLDNSEKLFLQEKENKIKPLAEQIKNLKINEIKLENSKIENDFYLEIQKQIAKLQEPLENLKKEKEVAVANEATRKDLLKTQESNNRETEEKAKEMSELKDEEKSINLKISAMKNYNSQKANIVNNIMSNHLNKASLKFEKTVESTGEIKDTFEVLYEDKELKNTCSNSEIIKTGIEISEMISKLSGYEAPVLIDNGESITKYDTSIVQVIETRVVKDKNLSILMDNGQEIEIKPKAIPSTKKKK